MLAALQICVTDDPAGIRSRITASAAMYTKLSSYQTMFEREGVTEPGKLGIVSSEAEVEEMLAGLAEAVGTDNSATSRDPLKRPSRGEQVAPAPWERFRLTGEDPGHDTGAERFRETVDDSQGQRCRWRDRVRPIKTSR